MALIEIRQMEPTFGKEERKAVQEYMLSGAWCTEHVKTRSLGKDIEAYTGAKHCVMMPNGTLTLYAALAVLGIGPGDQVLVPAFTQVATANVVRMVGAHPVFVDVEPGTLCMDLEEADRAAQGPYMRAMMYVPINGRAGNMEEVIRFCAERNLWLIEDAAQALGSFQDGKHLGTFGDLGSISFSTPKIISTGQGGCLLTDSDRLYEELLLFKNFGRTENFQQDEYAFFGINLKFSDLLAVIGIEQMKKLPWRVARKKEMFVRYQERLDSVDSIDFLPTDLRETAPWYMDVLVEGREGLIEALKKEGIQTRSFYPVIPHSAPYAQEYPQRVPVAENASKHGLWLPSSPYLRNEDIDYVCDVITRHYRS